eukprot:CAMPEP_0170554444 /NCGR_PEP_ID=MMETSP0211-20121228/12255_1 /TAXON_ID=311385 /ORGANISM="Pseudokeronopsis sp., Strain OXSARD2" /LENGTH=234 /DNA_ID=CAMNT_0010863471 /DNA_START=177 /DNA_END=881 /DNA_ORIENTATION=-
MKPAEQARKEGKLKEGMAMREKEINQKVTHLVREEAPKLEREEVQMPDPQKRVEPLKTSAPKKKGVETKPREEVMALREMDQEDLKRALKGMVLKEIALLPEIALKSQENRVKPMKEVEQKREREKESLKRRDQEPQKGIHLEETLMTLPEEEVTQPAKMGLRKRKETPLETQKGTLLRIRGTPPVKKDPLKAKEVEMRPTKGTEPPERRALELLETLPMTPLRILARMELLSL